MPMTYSFDVGDPICVEAAAGRLTNMYKLLNGYSMSDILKMLETLATGLKSISLNGSADIQKHLAAVDSAPIDTDRMKIAVTAVGLAGHVTSMRFQRDYESALAMVPSAQRQDILQFLAARAPAHSEDIPIQMNFDVFVQKTAWRIVTVGGATASAGWFTASAGNIYLHHGGDDGEDYTYRYYAVGTGKSISKASLTGSTKKSPGGGLGWLYRSGTRLADLPPEAFEGLGSIVSISAEVSPKYFIGVGGSVSLLMLATTDSFNAFSDVNAVPRSAGAVGMLYGAAGGLDTSKVDAGISWQAIRVSLVQ